ncbi:hypothetical protein ACFL4G_12350 [Thermodesulfobacteriota bacterium]
MKNRQSQPTSVTIPYKTAKQIAISNFDRAYLIRLLQEYRGNVSRASRVACLDRSNFKKILKKYRIDPNHYRTGNGDRQNP